MRLPRGDLRASSDVLRQPLENVAQRRHRLLLIILELYLMRVETLICRRRDDATGVPDPGRIGVKGQAGEFRRYYLRFDNQPELLAGGALTVTFQRQMRPA